MINAETAAIRYLNSHGKRDGLTDKARRVFDSCTNVNQLPMAMSYARRCAKLQQPQCVGLYSLSGIYEQEMLYAHEKTRFWLTYGVQL
jgi:hypothetical protein